MYYVGGTSASTNASSNSGSAAAAASPAPAPYSNPPAATASDLVILDISLNNPSFTNDKTFISALTFSLFRSAAFSYFVTTTPKFPDRVCTLNAFKIGKGTFGKMSFWDI